MYQVTIDIQNSGIPRRLTHHMRIPDLLEHSCWHKQISESNKPQTGLFAKQCRDRGCVDAARGRLRCPGSLHTLHSIKFIPQSALPPYLRKSPSRHNGATSDSSLV